MKFSVFQVSRRGGREKNEDRMGYCYTRDSGLFVLADGMGGHPEGEVAAQIALQSVSAMFQAHARPRLADPPSFLAQSILAAHRDVVRYAISRSLADSPRTTLVSLVVQGGRASWLHCGDSRLYAVREGQLIGRTRDHSYAEHQTAPGRGGDRVGRNVLFTCLGSPARPVFDIAGPIALQQGDKLLLCSDGLWGPVADDEIVALLGSQPVSVAVPELVELALRRTGTASDNVTALALEWETPDAFESTQGISTDSISDGEFESTIEATGPGQGIEEFDDAAIERSIAEINAAIRRSAGRRP